MCSRPYRPAGNVEFGCGKCEPCRINRLRLWQGRLLLESTQHPVSLFVTLTYDDVHLPVGETVVPRHLQLFLKRVRKYEKARAVRFFGVGEYGDKTWRPHYHVALFGSFVVERDDNGYARCGSVDRSWTQGYVHIGLITPESAGYLTAYTLKRMMQNGDPRLEGRHPEFIRMSLRPGIGKPALATIGGNLTDRKGAAFLAAKGDVPTQFTVHGKTYGLGRYLTQKLREEVGRERACPSAVQLAVSAERLAVPREVRESVRKQHANIAARKVQQRKQKVKL